MKLKPFQFSYKYLYLMPTETFFFCAGVLLNIHSFVTLFLVSVIRNTPLTCDSKKTIFLSLNIFCSFKPCIVSSCIASFVNQPVVHNWFIKGCGMYCSVYGKVHIKDPLLLIEKSSLCGGSGFPSKKCVNVTI